MLTRSINLPQSHTFFLFGARGTGKTSLLKQLYTEQVLYIDLLNLDNEARFQLDPESLYKELSSSSLLAKTVIIDEIQKVPKLLDVVHRKIEEGGMNFILTGSSARKLKRGGANLLAGRAFVFHLYPLTAHEIGDNFNLSDALQFGTLPYVATTEDVSNKRRFLKSYAQTYLKEEVWGEQLVRKIEPFRRFLQVAAQAHAQSINYSKIARDVGVDDSTISNYFSILEDTLVGFMLPAYSGSVRKQLKKTPKFYFFDNGVTRALEDLIDFPLAHGSFEYGNLFEQFVICEIQRRLSYAELGYTFSFFATEGGTEIDLLINQGRKVVVLVEIKSSSKISSEDLRHLVAVKDDFGGAKAYCLYGGSQRMLDNEIHIRPWREGVQEIVDFLMKR